MWRVILLSFLLGCSQVDISIIDKSPAAKSEKAETVVLDADPSMINIEGASAPSAETENKKANVPMKGGKK